MLLARRSFLAGLGAALVAAPAIVHARNIMPVRVIPQSLPEYGFDSFAAGEGTQYQWVARSVLGEATTLVEQMQSTGWRIVPAIRFNNQFAINGREIEHGGCVLMERAKALSDAARTAEIQRARGLVSDWQKRWESEDFEVAIHRSPINSQDVTS